MSNMHYCRFQNTLQDLRDCYDGMDDEMSIDEQRARFALIRLCCVIANECSEDGEPVYAKPARETA